MKIEPTTWGDFGIISIFPSAREPTETEILKISETDFRENYDLWMEAINSALRRLQPGFYTLVYPGGDVEDFWINKGGGVRFRPYDGITKNTIPQRACILIILT
jgi:hypothetical protein